MNKDFTPAKASVYGFKISGPFRNIQDWKVKLDATLVLSSLHPQIPPSLALLSPFCNKICLTHPAENSPH